MEKVYIYEDDFLSLLYLIKYLLDKKIKPYQIKNTLYSPSLFEELIYLSVPSEGSIIEVMESSFGKYAVRCIYYVFLSDEENKELILYYFILNAFKYKEQITKMRNLKCVFEVLRISQYVVHEAHKMKGFLRFRELKNKILYAEMEPQNDILFLASLHFQKRLPNAYWMIKDVKRGVYALYNKKNVFYCLEEEILMDSFLFSEEEKMVEELWKLFYKTIGIKERANPRCRRNFMPKKYWKYITEVRDEL